MATKIVNHKRKRNKYTAEFTIRQAASIRKEAKALGVSPAEVLRSLVDEALMEKYFPMKDYTEAQMNRLRRM